MAKQYERKQLEAETQTLLGETDHLLGWILLFFKDMPDRQKQMANFTSLNDFKGEKNCRKVFPKGQYIKWCWC